ncbi:1533_t:CDS:2 [Acaulospora morrowiae]|uniref:1533_t:CDS:1 n=1 Tax=Acaulospora morrowiae TaxID=94023 RepID=A0A9N9AJE6_9GLOM|nr:1533_t:CDS:2 [Acaulospora morrowiae]
MHKEVSNIVRLALHLLGMHSVIFDPNDDAAHTIRKQGLAIGRLYFANPSAGEIFYLQLLLTVVRGSQSFNYLKMVNNIAHPTFKDACLALGLLEDDKEWIQCLEKAAGMCSDFQLRLLFAVILIHCTPTQPQDL